MKVIHENDIELVNLKGRSFKLLADKETVGVNNLNAGFAFYPPKKHAPGHEHQVEEEVMYFIEGVGELVVDGKSYNVKPGSIAYVPPKKIHSINNTGEIEIKMLFMFSPPAKIGVAKDYNNE